MRRATMIGAVLGLFVGSLVMASMAEARAGGGRSSGSRGSRSYSAPQRPSTPAGPVAPGSPTSPQAFPTQPSPQRPGGFLGGLGGMLGGLALGGLLGSLLFGGFGRGLGGFGLMELLLVAGLAYLAYSFFRRRQSAPATAGGSGQVSSGWTPAEPARYEGAVATAPVETDLTRGIRAVRMMDASFDPVRFAEIARDVFVRVQVAWNGRDLAPVRGDLTDELAAGLEADGARLRTQRRLNRLEKLTVDGSEVTETWQEYGRDFVTVRFRASAIDYTIDETTGAVVEGNAGEPTSFEEYWTFTRSVGPNPWRLSAIQQPA